MYGSRYRRSAKGSTRWTKWTVAGLLAVLLGAAPPSHAQDSGRLLATSGVSQIEGSAGGGLAPWALITGYGTRDSFGASAHYTLAYLPSFTLHSASASIGIHDRVELSYAHQWFDTRDAGRKLGLGGGYQFHLDVVGAKVRLFGNAVYDQDTWLPQISVGVQLKTADRHDLVRALGARSTSGVDAYLSATKLFLAQSLLVNATVRATQANQFGLLGFGGDRRAGYSAEFEGSVALLLDRNFAVGAEVRTKPNNLRFAKEGTAYDVFAASFLNKNLSATLAFVAMGPIARQGSQNGVYLSLQGGF